MEKKASSQLIVMVLVVCLILSSGIIVWQITKTGDKKTEINETSDLTNKSENASSQESNGVDLTNQSDEENQTPTNESDNNQSTEPEIIDYSVPNPSGTIKAMDIRDDTNSGYFCDNLTNPKHQARLYTYRNINGTENLSEDYIESDEIDDVCNNYADGDSGVYYHMQWKWDVVNGIDGYRVYQSYSAVNITRDFDYSIKLSSSATQLLDTGLDLWRWEKPVTSNNTNSTT